jgi:hypothetical protein
MHPNAESPQAAADEVGVVVGDAEVIDGVGFARIEQVFDRQPLAVFAGKQIADFQFACGGPAFVFDIERVFGRRAYDFTGNVDWRITPSRTKNSSITLAATGAITLCSSRDRTRSPALPPTVLPMLPQNSPPSAVPVA